jgi:hypothetical protein
MIKVDRPSAYTQFLLFLICFLFTTNIGLSQQISVTVPDDSLTVGETFFYAITVKSSTSFDKVIFPDSSHFSGDLEFISSKHFKISENSDSTEFNLQFFGVEDIIIPPLPVRIVTNADTALVFTEPENLFYKQTIASEEDPLKPLKEIFKFPRTIWPYLLAFLLLIAAGIFIWWKYFKDKENEAPETVEIPDFQNPLSELENLLNQIKERHTNNPQKDYKRFYSELGDALRWYIEELYKIPALESTSREVIRYMDAFGVDVEMVKHTRIVLNEADMIKFAKFKPTLDQSWKAFHEGYTFLDRARIVDSKRIDRMKSEFENQFKTQQEENYGMG